MNLLLYTLTFLFGLILGSFFNVVGLRVPNKESIVRPGSHCAVCDRLLTAFELIPVLSYLFQKGKCRGCGTRISLLYPAVELLTAVLFTVATIFIGWSKELFVAWAFISLLMIVFVSDIKYMIIPDKVLFFFLPLFIVLRLIIPLDPWWDMIVGGAVGFGLLFFIAVLSKGGMGGGDIKLMGTLGIVLGWKATLLTFFLSTVLGSLIGVVGLFLGKVKRGVPFPFGPFIVFGTITAYFFYETILSWYIDLMT
ncbi:prepilin peptidase [Fictibacillus gelatini]|uniref:prepilin peptidase n=1 Tax=Fictibacillus gelatini TaxID=225985 RepID=UPI000411DAFB|nr:A24 family peptidase [Fictibacillus gelatini]